MTADPPGGPAPRADAVCDGGEPDRLSGLLRGKLERLADEGAEFVPFDEPVLSEVVFAGRSATRTSMCVALAGKSSPTGELKLAVDLVNRVVDGIEGPTAGIHVRRGNGSRKDDVLPEGSYGPLMPWFARMRPGFFALERATPRAGPVDVLGLLPPRAILGFGAVNPRTAAVEDPEAVAALARRAAALLGPERVHVNPDCGSGTFAERPVNDADTARRILRRG